MHSPLPEPDRSADRAPGLERRLGLTDAVFIGLGSMIGAGVFAVFAPAATAAGTGLLLGLLVAAAVAFANAMASAQLAAAHPTSGGSYAYGRAELGEWWGFAAGWGFVIGKTASCAAMAMVFAAYVAPAGGERLIGIAAVVCLSAVNWFGITRTARLTRIIVVAVLAVLALAVAAGFSITGAAERLSTTSLWSGGGYGILQSAGLLFFAFAGYARIATLGEEVREPRRTIPRAIVISFVIAACIYLIVAVMVLAALGPAATADSHAPLADAVAASGWSWAVPWVSVGAALASLGALLGLIAGVGRTSFAMARAGDLPRTLAAVHPRWKVPHHAQLVLTVAVVALIALVDVRGAIGFSSFGVLLYYFVTNLAAWRQSGGARRTPRALQLFGAAGCLILTATLPGTSIAAGLAVFTVGALWRAATLRRSRRFRRAA